MDQSNSFRTIKHFADVEPNLPTDAWVAVREALDQQFAIHMFKVYWLPVIQEHFDKQSSNIDEPLYPKPSCE